MTKFPRAAGAAMLLGLIALAIPGPVAAAEAPAAFAQCRACHATEPGKHVFGPSLASVSGRKAGSLADFSYSDALKASGLTWDEATLDRWLTSPQKTVPGTRMPFAGIRDPEMRREVVAYLLTLR